MVGKFTQDFWYYCKTDININHNTIHTDYTKIYLSHIKQYSKNYSTFANYA